MALLLYNTYLPTYTDFACMSRTFVFLSHVVASQQAIIPALGFGTRLGCLTVQPFTRHVWLEQDILVCRTWLALVAWGSLSKFLQPLPSSSLILHLAYVGARLDLLMRCRHLNWRQHAIQSKVFLTSLFAVVQGALGPSSLVFSCEY